MTATIWSKFFWSDWANDETLKLCSMAAQGLWLRMLCIAAAAHPIGYVSVNGNALDETGIARLTGADVSEVANLLAELDRNGVFSRDRSGRIYSRRMVRDAKKRVVAQRNGKTGGNPSLRKDDDNPPLDNHPLKGDDNTHEPRARSQEPEEEKAKPSVSPKSRGTRWPIGQAIPSEWIAWAKSAFPSVPKAKLEEQARQFADYWPGEPRGVKLDWERTWRNWLRKSFPGLEIEIAGAAAITVSAADWSKRINYARNNREWSTPRWGPMPGLPDCKVPSDLLELGDGNGWQEMRNVA